MPVQTGDTGNTLPLHDFAARRPKEPRESSSGLKERVEHGTAPFGHGYVTLFHTAP
jgi:hypothetical protein